MEERKELFVILENAKALLEGDNTAVEVFSDLVVTTLEKFMANPIAHTLFAGLADGKTRAEIAEGFKRVFLQSNRRIRYVIIFEFIKTIELPIVLASARAAHVFREDIGNIFNEN